MLGLVGLIYEESSTCYMQSMGRSSPYRGFRIIGKQRQAIYARSLWEANYAHYLQWLQDRGEITYWLHEPRVFYFEGIKRGTNNYTPDFFVSSPKGDYFVEVKGYLDVKSKTKIRRFKKFFEDEKLIVVDSKWFAKNGPLLKKIVPNWETPRSLSIISKEVVVEMRKKKKT